MLSWIYGKYFYLYELLNIIDEIETKRQLRRLKGSTMSSTFAQDLKNKLNGIEITGVQNKDTECSHSYVNSPINPKPPF